MLAFIKDNQIVKYPISLGDLKEKFPNTSFNLPLNAADLTDFGVVEVEILPIPVYDPALKRVEAKDPEYVDGKWVAGYKVSDIPQKELDEIAKRNSIELENSLRKERDHLLAESDWTQLPDAPDDHKVWAAYRQALRDVTSQPGFPHNVTWPQSPDMPSMSDLTWPPKTPETVV